MTARSLTARSVAAGDPSGTRELNCTVPFAQGDGWISSSAQQSSSPIYTILMLCCRWDKLQLVRVYTKPKGKMPDYTAPVVLRSTKCTVEDFVSFTRSGRSLAPAYAHESSPRHQARRQVQIANHSIRFQCNAIHKTIVEQFKVAIVYGKSVKHQPQRVGLSHELTDEDISK